MIKIQHDFLLSYAENAAFRFAFFSCKKNWPENKIKFLHLLHCLVGGLAAVAI